MVVHKLQVTVSGPATVTNINNCPSFNTNVNAGLSQFVDLTSASS